MKWQYMTVKVDVVSDFLGGPKVDAAISALNAELERLGDEGWELATAFDVNLGGGVTSAVVLFFKRPAPE